MRNTNSKKSENYYSLYSIHYSHNQLVEQEAWNCYGTVSLILFFNAWYLDYLPELGMRCTFNAFLLFEE